MDQTDERILSLLKDNARMSFQELGEHLKISRVAAMKRVRKLEKTGVIRGYNTHICRKDQIAMIIDIVTTPEAFQEVMRYLTNQTSFICKMFRTTKANHIHLVVASTSIDELQYLSDRIRKDCGHQIIEFESYTITQVVKDDYGGIRAEEWAEPEEQVLFQNKDPASKTEQWISGGNTMYEVSEKNRQIIEKINRELGDCKLEDIQREGDGHFRYTVSLSEAFLTQDIQELELSVRSYNCLKRAGISTIGELVNQIDSRADLLKIRNLGQKSASEIMLCLFLSNYMYLKPEKRKGYLERVKSMNGK